MKQITTSAGIIYNKKGEILCSLRDQGKYDYVSFKWEFPGGKIEEGETFEQTLIRELQEELEININILEKYYQVEHDYPDFHLSMTIFKCNIESGKIHMNVHKALKWVKPSELMNLDWAKADLPVAQKLYDEYTKDKLEKDIIK